MLWNEVVSQDSYKKLDEQGKAKVKVEFFNTNLKPQFEEKGVDLSEARAKFFSYANSLEPLTSRKIINEPTKTAQDIISEDGSEYLQSKNQPTSYKYIEEKRNYPKGLEKSSPALYAGMKAASNTGRILAQGATLGASEYVRGKLNIDEEKYGDIPSEGKMVGELAGSFAPVSAIGNVIGKSTPALARATGITSKMFQPTAKAASWAIAGAGVGATEKVFKKGELPTAKELGNDAILWGGTEAIINSLGWGYRMTKAVKSLSESYNTTPKKILNLLFENAKNERKSIVDIATREAESLKELKRTKDVMSLGKEEIENLSKEDVKDAANEFVSVAEALAINATNKRKNLLENIDKEIEIANKKFYDNRAKSIFSNEQKLLPTQGFELKGKPTDYSIFDVVYGKENRLSLPSAKEPLALPPAQGFELVGRTKEQIGESPFGFEGKFESPKEKQKVEDILSSKELDVIAGSEGKRNLVMSAESKFPIGQTTFQGSSLKENQPERMAKKIKEPSINFSNITASERKALAKEKQLKEDIKQDIKEDKVIDTDVKQNVQKLENNEIKTTYKDKKELLNAVDKAILETSNVGEKIKRKKTIFQDDIESYVVKKGEQGTITFTMGSGAKYEILNNRSSLEDFRKKINKSSSKYLYNINPIGLISGIDTDKDGTIQYDPYLGSVGMAAAAILSRGKSKQRKFTDSKENPTNSEKAKGMFERTELAISQKESLSAKNALDNFKRWFLDVSAKSKDMVKSVDSVHGRKIEMLRNATAGANSEALRQFEVWRESIYKGRSDREKRILDIIIGAKRNIAIAEYKPEHIFQEGLKKNHFEELLKDIKEGKNADGLNKKQIDELFDAADKYAAAQQETPKRLYDAGIITKEAEENLSKVGIYSPRQTLDHLNDLDKNISGRSISVRETGIKELNEGTMSLVETRSELLLKQSIMRREDVIARNNANLGLLEMADKFPENSVARRAEIIGYTKDGKPKFQEANAGESKLSVFENGVRTEMIVPKEFAESWVKSDPLINHSLATTLQWVTGTKTVKMVATGMNPTFFLGNMPRDILMVWTGGQYSRVLPVAAAQFAKDFVSTYKDAFFKKGRAIDYIKEGGGMEFQTYYGLGGALHNDKIKGFIDVLKYTGETSEIWTRLAHRERALQNLTKDFKSKNGRPPNADEQKLLQFEATQIAREGGIDFSQGGSVIKAIDNFIPYLNATVQGTRTMARNAIKAPVAFTSQVAQLGALSTLLYYWNGQNPEALSQISDRDKASNFILIVPDLIPGLTSYTNDKGEKVYRYVKIAKEQSIQVFTSAFESIAEFKETGKIPSKQIFLAMESLGASYKVPLFSAITALAGNLDDYEWKKLWKGSENIEDKEKYYSSTPKAFVKAGEATGASPVGLQSALGKIVPFGNPIVSLGGSAIQIATGELGEEIQKKGWNQFISENRSLKRVLSTTNPSNEYGDMISDAKTKSETYNLKQNRRLDELSDMFLKSNDQKIGAMIEQYIYSQPVEDQERLIKRYNTAYDLKDVPDRRFWVSMKTSSPEARAEILFERYRKMNPDQQKELLKTADSIKGVVTDRVINEFQNLLKGGKSKYGTK